MNNNFKTYEDRKIVINLTKVTLLICSIIPFFIHLLTGHIGDLNYYIFANDNSIRTLFSTLIFKLIWFITPNYTFLILIWCVLIYLISSRVIKYLNNYSKVTIVSVSPFLFFPSKESVLFLFFMISIILFSNHKKIKRLIIMTSTLVVRPMLMPLILFSYSKKLLYILGYISIFFFLIFFVAVENIWQSVEQLFFIARSYAYGYFASANSAGSTDFEFLNSMNDMGIIEFMQTSFFRFMFPVWMLDLNLSSKIYFCIYINILIFCAIHFSSYRPSPSNLFTFLITYFVIGICLIGFMPLCVTNAGSAVRYLSLAFIVVLLISSSKKEKYLSITRYRNRPA
jgi:hypothetical protein